MSVLVFSRMNIENERSMKLFRNSILTSLALAAWMMTSSPALAQFHNRSGKSHTTKAQTPSNVGMQDWTYGEMDARDPTVWGRSIFHSNGNFTQTKLDERQRTLEQLTYRKKIKDSDDSVLLQKRLIKLNTAGRPTEVLLYDAAGRLTNRGTLHYDPLGRMVEERLFDTKNTVVRRKIQAYSTAGQRLPLRTFNYGDGVAHDLDLMITRESAQKEKSTKKKKGGFLKKLQFWKKKK